MINTLEDLLNIKNFVKLHRNLANLKSLIFKYFFSYPNKKLARYSNNLLKNSLMRFWIWIIKKNNYLKYYFFKEEKKKYPELLVEINHPGYLKKKFTKKFVFFHFGNLEKFSLINLNKFN